MAPNLLEEDNGPTSHTGSIIYMILLSCLCWDSAMGIVERDVWIFLFETIPLSLILLEYVNPSKRPFLLSYFSLIVGSFAEV